MNWFARYEIPGLYFCLLLGALSWIVFGFSIKEGGLPVLGVALSASLPLGYILVIFSQFLYYQISPWRVHRRAWGKTEIKEEKEEAKKEWWVETKATILARLKCHDTIDGGRWVQEWFAKRFDVMAINWALIVGTVIGGVLPSVFAILVWFFRPSWLSVKLKYLCCFEVASFFIIFILYLSNCLLTKQAVYLATEYYKILKNESKQPRYYTTAHG